MSNNIDLVIFGARGDLSKRKLFPALYHLDKAGLLADSVRIAGVAREDIDTCLLYTSPSPRDRQKSRMPSSA